MIKNEFYSKLIDNSNNDRKQELPTVKDITVVKVEETKFEIKEVEYDGYSIELEWEYDKDLGYDKKAEVIIVKSNDKLYVAKINTRIATLKTLPEYGQIQRILPDSIDSIVARYFKLKDAIEANCEFPTRLVISHGDPCFANTLYHKSSQLMKFIDPKGALTEDELYLHPYYDIAKLSHSVCGRYDFFNSGLFEIKINENLAPELMLDFDNEPYKAIFRQKAEANGFVYLAVRIYEVSLFLSMCRDGSIFPHIGITLFETLISFLLVFLVSLILSTLLWHSTKLSEIMEPIQNIISGIQRSTSPRFVW